MIMSTSYIRMSAIAAVLPIFVKTWMLGGCLVGAWKMVIVGVDKMSKCQFPSSSFTAAVRGAAQAAAAQEKVTVITSVINLKQIQSSFLSTINQSLNCDMHATQIELGGFKSEH